jgi:VWFA-related protein
MTTNILKKSRAFIFLLILAVIPWSTARSSAAPPSLAPSFDSAGAPPVAQYQAAQNKPTQQPPTTPGNPAPQTPAKQGDAQGGANVTFKSRTELVLVPVIAHDRRDAHVPGLTKDDFIVQENGADQKIAVFEEVHTSAAPVRRTRAPGVFTNAMQQGSSNVVSSTRLNIIVMDTLNTPFLDQTRARQALIKFLEKTVQSGELTALLSLDQGGVHVIHDFTEDMSVLTAALQRVKGKTNQMAGENTEALNSGADQAASIREADDILSFLEARQARMMQQFTIQSTLDAFATIARAFGGIPGRKALIWVTGSFPFLVTSADDPPMARGFENEMEHAFQLLNDANISVYPVDARGLVVGMWDISQRPSYNPRNPGAQVRGNLDALRKTLDTMQAFAAETGGRAFYNTNDIEGAFHRAAEDSASYYLLGYYRDTSGGDKPGWRKLKVKAKRDGLHLRSRTGYFVVKQTEKDDKADIRLAVGSPMDFTGVLFAVRYGKIDPGQGGRNGSGNKRIVHFDIVIDRNALTADASDNNHMSFQVLALARNAQGDTVGELMQTIDAHPRPASLEDIRTNGLGYRGTVSVEPGQYTVRFVIKDNLSGRIGTVSAPLKVE